MLDHKSFFACVSNRMWIDIKISSFEKENDSSLIFFLCVKYVLICKIKDDIKNKVCFHPYSAFYLSLLNLQYNSLQLDYSCC